MLEGNLEAGSGLEKGGLWDVPKPSVITGDDGKGGSGRESRLVSWNMSGRGWRSSELS